MTTTSETIGDRIRTLRRGRGLSQGELAGQVGLTQTTVSNYERGKRTMDIDTARSLADHFGVSLEWLANGGSP